MNERLNKTEKLPAELTAESKEELIVDKVYQFTHPNFHATHFPHQTKLKKYRELRQRWTKAIEEIEHDGHALLFYVTAFTVKDFQDLAQKSAV